MIDSFAEFASWRILLAVPELFNMLQDDLPDGMDLKAFLDNFEEFSLIAE